MSGDERPLTRRELRERERLHAEARPSIEPVDWRVGTADMGPVREQLDARLASAGTSPGTASAPPAAQASDASEAAPSRRGRRRDPRFRDEARQQELTPVVPEVEPDAEAVPEQVAAIGEPGATTVPQIAVPGDTVDPVGHVEPTPIAQDAVGEPATEAEIVFGVDDPSASGDPITVDDQIEAGGGDVDDYFERLAVASAGDAPTGMIVMPELLNPEITGALSRSGDVMVTGSMRVSRDLSSYGAYRDGLDSDDTDDDADVLGDRGRGEHAPVSARDAISSRARTGVRMTPSPERRLNTWIWIVVGAIGVVVVGGAGVLLYGLMSGWF